MNRSRSTALLALALLFLAAPARSADPFQQFGQVLDSTVAQLGLLGANTYNAGSFATLQNLLANLFGSMMTLSEPYFNSYIGQMLAQNAAYLQQIAQLEAKNAASNSVVFNLLNSASATLGSIVANIGGTLVQFQNMANLKLMGLQNSYSSSRQILDNISGSLSSLTNNVNLASGKIDQVFAAFPALEQAYNKAMDHIALVTTVISTSSAITIDPVSSHCGTREIDVSDYFTYRKPYVAATTSALISDPAAVTSVEYFYTSLVEITPLAVTVQVCTKSGNPIDPIVAPFVIQVACY